MKPSPGDTIKIATTEATFEGILLQRPALFEPGFIVLKLDNGYNIGIEEKKIKKIETIKQYEMPIIKRKEFKHNPKLPTVAILSTGGTISSRIDYKTGGVIADYTADDFIQMCPELAEVANMKAKKVMGIMSEDLLPEDWKKMAEFIAEELNNKDIAGVVVTHGTDTMHYTAAALHFFLKNINKPVIITGSQRSIDRGSTDAFMNLICSVTAAARFDGAVVATCLHGSTNDDYCILNRGGRVRKMHTARRDAFQSIDELPLAKVFPGGSIEVINTAYKKRADVKVEVEGAFEKKIAIIEVFPGMDPGVINFYLDKGFKGIILNATALGHVPTVFPEYSLMDALQYAREKKVPVIVSSQTINGRVHPFVYTNLRKLSIERDCIFVEDMLPEVAYVKLGWVLAKTQDTKKVKELMLTNYIGEITERSDPRAYPFDHGIAKKH